MSKPDLNSAKERLYLQTQNGILTNFPLRHGQFQSLKKLKYSAIMRAADLKEADGYNLSYLSNQTFHKDIVNIVHGRAVNDSNRQRRETRAFFEENIIAEGPKLMAAERVVENLMQSLSEENIHKYLVNITGYGTENIKFRDLVQKERNDKENTVQQSGLLRDEALVSLIELNRELLEDLRSQRKEPKLIDRPKNLEVENTEYTLVQDNQQQKSQELVLYQKKRFLEHCRERQRA